jgi:ribosome maturation protein SDO1
MGNLGGAEKSKNENFIVKYKKEGVVFEILVDFENLEKFKEEKEEIDVYDVVFDTDIYFDIKKAKRADKESIEKAFENIEEKEILSEILKKGDCQIPTQFKNKRREEIKNQIIQYIVDSCINPQTNSKFTNSTILDQIEKISFSINTNMDHIHQAEEVIKKLTSIMPIKISMKNILMTIPSKYSNKFLGEFRKYGKITKELWDNHGDLKLHMEINENNLDRTIEFIKRNSNGEAEYHTENN